MTRITFTFERKVGSIATEIRGEIELDEPIDTNIAISDTGRGLVIRFPPSVEQRAELAVPA